LGLAKTKAENILTCLTQLSELQETVLAGIKPIVAIESKPVARSVVEESPVEKESVSEVKIEPEPKPEIASVTDPEIQVIPEPVVTIPAPEAQPMVETTQEEPAKSSLAEVLNANGHSLNDQLSEKAGSSLANILSNAKVEDLRQALSLAERFRFQRELFNGNGEKLNTTLQTLNGMKSLEEAMAYLSAFGWPEESNCVVEFNQLVQRKFL
jgi:hypothetical protein